MSWILKILQGPNEGAEIELADGRVTRIGGADSCDIVLFDSMLAKEALDIDCKGQRVSITPLSDGCFLGERLLAAKQTEALPPCTVLSLGGSRLCVGPSDEPWPEVTWPDLEKLRISALPPLTEAEILAIADKARADAEAKVAAEQAEKAALEASKPRKPKWQLFREWLVLTCRQYGAILLHGVGLILMVAGLLLLMLAAGWQVYLLSTPPVDGAGVVKQIREDNFDTLVKQFALQLNQKGENLMLAGNLTKRNDRLRLSAAAYVAHPHIKLDLSDDETLGSSISELLFGLTEGGVILDSARNRTAKVVGMTVSKESWKEIQAILRADIPMLELLESDVIFADEMMQRFRHALKTVGLTAVQIRVEKNQFIFFGHVEEARKEDMLTVLREVGKMMPSNVAVINSVRWTENVPVPVEEPAARVQVKQDEWRPVAQKSGEVASERLNLPISGIMVTPFRCLVLSDGSRCSEGGAVNGYIVENIKEDEVTLRRGGQTFTWRP